MFNDIIGICLPSSFTTLKMPSMRHTTRLSYFLIFFLALNTMSALALAPREKSRRAFISKAIPSLFLVGCLDVKPAQAVKERNEALCSTGFFTNIGELLLQHFETILDYEPLAAHIKK